MSDSSFMNIQFETLQQAQDDLGIAYSGIKNTIDELETQLTSNLSQWSGSAQQAYIPVKQSWDQAILHMQTVLNKAGAHMASAQETYQATENQNASIWGA
ncbi:MAG: WXG100 family type VII secretion target [Actinomycetota bacterium]|nr:WXG100 family type VII secretion target [Actinomycetota bacterium]